ncbi:MAG: penicillin acylase family protein [Cyclonatronaceae bacterium]
MKTFLKALLVTALLFTAVLALTVYWSLYRPMPGYGGSATLPGLTEPVTIEWDEAGVPHIYAENQADLYYALGYIHARDRLWQITLHQLTIQGRFAEFLGEDFIETDRFLRTLGLAHTASENRPLYNNEETAILQAYTNGINDYVSEHTGELPLEFSLLDIKPVPFTVNDAIAIPRLMAWNLNLVWKSKVVVAQIAETKSPDTIRRLLPAAMAGEIIQQIEENQADTVPEAVPVGSLIPLLDTDSRVRAITGMDAVMQGSNAWVVDGTKTASGLPILAGDPHLGLGVPSIWYEARLNLNGRNVAGVTVPGNPLIFIGRNDQFAWSLTSLMADALDFFSEAPDPLDRGRYVTDSTSTDITYAPFRIRREIIRVLDGDEILHEVKITRNGPVISDVHELDLLNDRLISMSWTGNHPGNEMRPGLALNWGDHYEDIIELREHHTAPGLNLLYADQSGNIAHFVLGKIPVRTGSALFFRKGWLPEQSWRGYVPDSRMPAYINPPLGWLANANNRINDSRIPNYISHFWEHPSRYERIREVLGNGTDFEAAAMKDLQNDVFSHHARNITGSIMPVLEQATGDSLIRNILPYLSNWNYQYDVNSTAASILDAFVLAFSRMLAADELGEELYPHYMNMMHLPQLVVEEQLVRFSESRADTLASPVYSDEMILQAMKEGINMLRDRYGQEPWQWRWLNPHKVTFSPLLFREAAEMEDAGRTRRLIVRNTMSRGPYPAPGHGMSVNNGSYRGSDPFNMHAGPSYRFIADFSWPGYYDSVLPPGQSGWQLSHHFDDQIELWLQGAYKRVYFTGESSDGVPYRVQTLNPEL